MTQQMVVCSDLLLFRGLWLCWGLSKVRATPEASLRQCAKLGRINQISSLATARSSNPWWLMKVVAQGTLERCNRLYLFEDGHKKSPCMMSVLPRLPCAERGIMGLQGAVRGGYYGPILVGGRIMSLPNGQIIGVIWATQR